jgi:hypothetical protein
MPQTLHDVIQKALIAEEDLISGGQSRTPVRPAGQVSSGATSIRHQPDICQDIMASRGDPLSLHLSDDASTVDTLSGTTTSTATSMTTTTV